MRLASLILKPTQRAFLKGISHLKLSSLLILLLMVAGAGKSFAQTPTITSVSPNYGAIGSVVTIRGNNLSNITAATIGSVAVPVVYNDANQVRLYILSNTVSGRISLTTAGGTVQSTTNFDILPSDLPKDLVYDRTALFGTNGEAGRAVDVSASARYMIIGAPAENSATGAAWVVKRGNCGWTIDSTVALTSLVTTGLLNSGSRFGSKVALSADGRTAAVSAPGENSGAGAVYIFRRQIDLNIWSYETRLSLVGAPVSQLGASLSFAADGNTLAVGAPADNANTGSVYVFRFTSGAWSTPVQITPPATGVGAALGKPLFGSSVAFSADGSTLAIGGPEDEIVGAITIGAVWIYTSSSGTYAYQNKIKPTDYIGGLVSPRIGTSVSLSARGNVLIFGAPGNDAGTGAGWVYTRTSGVWATTGTKLEPTSAKASVGISVDLSADGSTLIIGGDADDVSRGSIWLYTRSGGSISAPTKLFGSNSSVSARQGFAAAIATDGSLIVSAGYGDNGNKGAVWSFGALPTFTDFSPKTGGANQTITLSGVALTNTQSVTVGGINASFAILNNNAVAVTLPAGVPLGPTNVILNTFCNGSFSLGGFQFIPPAEITGFSPDSVGQGQSVTITGNNLQNTTVVRFGTVTGTITSQSASSITATVGSGETGNISVTSAGTQYTYLAKTFRFIPAPQVISATPNSAFALQTITINGSNFRPGNTTITFGGVSATIVSATTTSLQVTVPPNAGRDITVTTPGGTNTLTNAFTLTYPAPQINSFSPTTAGTDSVVVIRGRQLNETTPSVTINGTAVTNYIRVTSDSIVVTVPAGVSTTTGSICVTTLGGTTCRSTFTYAPAPTITAITPAAAGEAATIVITGTNFTANSRVSFGGTPARRVTFNSATQLTVVLGSGSAGAVTVNTTGGRAVFNGFSFLTLPPTITSITPATAVALQPVQIRGTNLGSITSVQFGTRSAFSFRIVNDTLIIAKPDSASGNQICVTNRLNATACSNAFTFTSIRPTVSSFSTTTIGLGTSLLVRGANLGIIDSIKFGGVICQLPLQRISNDSLRVIVGNGASGRARLYYRFNGVKDSSGLLVTVFTYYDTPDITSVSPDSAGEDDLITIRGLKFFGAVSTVSATLGGIPLTLNGFTASTVASPTGTLSVRATTGQDGPLIIRLLNGNDTIPFYNYYYKAPTISTTSASSARPGTEITVTGTRFLGNVRVRVGGILLSASQFTVVNSKTIKFIVPNTTNPDSLFYRISTPGGTVTRPFTWLYPTPEINSFSPTRGPTGTLVRINGRVFETGKVTSVKIGGTNAASFSVVDSFTIAAVVGSGSSGAIQVTTAGGTYSFGSFEYLPPPTISALSSTDVWPGTTLTITGTNFNEIISVSLNGAQAEIISATATSIQIRVGTSHQATGKVIVATSGGVATSASDVTFAFRKPSLLSASSLVGGTGETLTFTGADFYSVSGFTIGGSLPASYTVDSPTQITAVLSSGSSGDIIVTTPGGTDTIPDFVFVRPPAITSVSPLAGGVGTTLTIRGTNFDSVRTVLIGTVVDTPSITGFGTSMFITISNRYTTGGLVKVISRGGTDTYPIPFTLIPQPRITSFSPAEGEKGTTITVTGQNFNDSIKVYLGLVPVTNFRYISPTSISFQVPQNASVGFNPIQMDAGISAFTNSTDRFRVIGETPRSQLELEDLFSISPNPTTGPIVLKGKPVPSSNSILIEVMSVNGAVVYTKSLPPFNGDLELPIDLTGVPPGYYVLYLTIGRQQHGWGFLKY